MGYEDTIENLKKAIAQKQTELEALQITVNQLCKLDNKPPLYNVISGHDTNEVPQEKDLKGDEYYGKPLATVITEILQKRKDRIGPATIEEILNRMKEGGYVFDARDPLRAVSISMGKNPKFTKLPNEKWGLTEWYPTVKGKKEANKVSLDETAQYATGLGIKQPQQEAETPVVVKKVGRPKKLEDSKEDTKE